MRRLVIGDVHGRILALKEVLKKSKFDYDKDKLIILGDVVDGGYNTYLVVEELLKIKNRILIFGNHEEMFRNHLKTGWAEEVWTCQGGNNTIDSYKRAGFDRVNIPVTHQDFFNRGKYYHVEDNMAFVHGGYNPHTDLQYTKKEVLLWDREIILFAKKRPLKKYKLVFIGHTTTEQFTNELKPLKFNNLWMMDCGAGWTGKLAIMDIDTEEYWLSKKQEPAE